MADDQQDPTQRETYGSQLAQMFGYVTPEDRSRWQQNRSQQRSRVSTAKQGAKASANAMMEFGERNMHSKLDAAHRMNMEHKFDETHETVRNRRRDPKTQSIIESVDYRLKDDRILAEPQVGDDLEFG